MKFELELDEGIYQAIKRLTPGVDLKILLSELLKGVVIIIATHPEEFRRGYEDGESKEILDERVQKLLPKIIEKATLGVYECDDCHQQFALPQEDFDRVVCPSCGKEWAIEELPKLKTN